VFYGGLDVRARIGRILRLIASDGVSSYVDGEIVHRMFSYRFVGMRDLSRRSLKTISRASGTWLDGMKSVARRESLHTLYK